MTGINFEHILKTVLEDSQFVFSKHEPFVKNYKRKIQKEIYQESLARKGLDHYIPQAIETYNNLTDSNTHLNKQDKEIFKGTILKRILEDIGN